MSQFFWLSREAQKSTNNETMFNIWVRGQNSAHLRLEPQIPHTAYASAAAEASIMEE